MSTPTIDTGALFPEHFDCQGGCGGTGYLPSDQDGWCAPCPACNEHAVPIYDPENSPLPF